MGGLVTDWKEEGLEVGIGVVCVEKRFEGWEDVREVLSGVLYSMGVHSMGTWVLRAVVGMAVKAIIQHE